MGYYRVPKVAEVTEDVLPMQSEPIPPPPVLADEPPFVAAPAPEPAPGPESNPVYVAAVVPDVPVPVPTALPAPEPTSTVVVADVPIPQPVVEVPEVPAEPTTLDEILSSMNLNEFEGGRAMGLIQKAEEWIFGIALKKVLKRAVPWVTALVTGPIVVGKLNTVAKVWGVKVDIDPTAFTAGLGGLLTGAQNWLKVKTGWTFL